MKLGARAGFKWEDLCLAAGLLTVVIFEKAATIWVELFSNFKHTP